MVWQQWLRYQMFDRHAANVGRMGRGYHKLRTAMRRLHVAITL